MQMAPYVEDIAEVITPELLEKTTSIIQTQLLQAFAAHASTTIPLRSSRYCIVNLINALTKEQETIGENVVLNIIDAATNLQYCDPGLLAPMRKFLRQLNEFVVQMAVENEDLVSINFLLRLLEKNAKMEPFNSL